LSLFNDSRARVYVVAVGATTPLGRDAWSSAAAVRASVSGFTDHPYIVDTVGEPMRIAMSSWLDIGCHGIRRFEALLFPAIEQLYAEVRLERARVGLIVALPAPRPGLPAGLEDALRSSVADAFGNRFTMFSTFSVGHAGGLLAAKAAKQKIEEGVLEACVIAGVESYLDAVTLEWLEASDQLHGAGSLNNAWGFIPGEGAGAVLLASESTVSRSGAKPLSYLVGVGAAVEQNQIKTQTVCVGDGLTAAFRNGLAGLPPGGRVTDVYCDMNGEPYRADEFGFAILRTSELFAGASDFVAPADCWGDVSAASGPLCLMLATVAGVKSYAKGNHAIVWASSEEGARAAALIEVAQDN